MILEHRTFDLKDRMIFEKAKLKPPLSFKNPMPNEACFLYVIEGEQDVIGEVQAEHLSPDEGVLMKCGNFYSNWIVTDPDQECEAFAVHFYPEVLKELYEKDIPDFFKEVDPDFEKVTLSTVKADTLIKAYVESMLFYFEHPELVNDEIIKLKMKELLILLMKTDRGPEIRHLISSLFTPQQFSFKEVIASNLYREISLEDLAQLTSLSLSSFKREFKKIYDESPGRYVKRKKLERASELLKHTDKRISDIAYECGFHDLAHFSRSFQEAFSISPSKYRG